MATPKKPAKPVPKPAKSKARAPAKSSYHHGDLRRALLDAGLALIEEQGAQAFTLREAARRAGVSQAAPYRHFVDKGALLSALADEGFRALTARMRAEVAREGAPPGTMEPIGMGYLLFAVENPAHYRVMFGPGLHQSSAGEVDVDHDSFQVLLDGVVAGQRSGALRAGDTMELALFAWSIVHGFALLVIDGIVPFEPGGDGMAFRRLAASMLRLSLEGMAPRSA